MRTGKENKDKRKQNRQYNNFKSIKNIHFLSLALGYPQEAQVFFAVCMERLLQRGQRR